MPTGVTEALVKTWTTLQTSAMRTEQCHYLLRLIVNSVQHFIRLLLHYQLKKFKFKISNADSAAFKNCKSTEIKKTSSGIRLPRLTPVFLDKEKNLEH